MIETSAMSLLAEDGGFNAGGVLFIIVVVGLSFLGTIIGKIKKAQEEANRQAQLKPRRQPGQPPPANLLDDGQPPLAGDRPQPPAPEADAVAALRQALGWGPSAASPPAPMAPAGRRGLETREEPTPPSRGGRSRTPVRRPAPHAEYAASSPVPQQETVAQHHLHAPLDVMDLDTPVVAIAAVGVLDEGTQRHTADASAQPLFTVRLNDRANARTGIIVAEILGPPKGLRTGPERWEL